MADADSICVDVLQHSSYGDMARCHPDRPAASRGLCQRCYKQWLCETPKHDRPPVVRAWKRPARMVPTCHPDAEYGAHGLCQPCYLAAYRQENRERLLHLSKRKHYLTNYGITLEERDQLIAQQGGVCAICKQPPAKGKVLHVDHCHKTGKVRGMLCHLCNSHLGLVDRDPAVLTRLTAYVDAP
jgi:hypothetical protein